MTRRVGYQHRVRVDGMVGSVEAIQSGIVRVRFRDKTERLVHRGALSIAHNTIDRPPKPSRPRRVSVEKSLEHQSSLISRILQVVCRELGIATTAARRRLRKAGLRAPYNDEAAIRAALNCITQENSQ